ncbi:MAG: hypothetical protein EOM40_10270 [Clostridia bacterium]|nr:hypothetical protein [Clostridia bacterium]NCC42287.1 hypothetical protein [Clostridia bacterium]
MLFDDEKDYLMRMIKEMARVLFSIMLGKSYVQVELPEENKYEISGNKLEEYLAMVDRGEINEAENRILADLDYNDQGEVTAAVFFYQHIGEKDPDFLEAHNYSEEEVLDGLKQLAKQAGYGNLCDLID